ncbi:MAG TPA: hypothetical protein ENI07_22255 [Desulfobacterales bacterium]|nr:hypothetical protein [Desulfobacterales bacterium]
MVVTISKNSYHINIFGPLNLQNELLADLISKETGFACQCCKDTDIAQVSQQAGRQKHPDPLGLFKQRTFNRLDRPGRPVF